MKKVVMILMVLMMLVGCGSSASAKEAQYKTSKGFELRDATLISMAQIAIEKYDRQSDPDVKFKTVEAGEETEQVDGYTDDLYKAGFDYTWQDRPYTMRMLVYIADKEGRYKVVRYENRTTGTYIK